MAVGFGTVSFDVFTSDATIPSPVPGDLCDTYTATVRVSSSSDREDLYAYYSKVTEKPAMGGRNLGTAVIEWGDGERTLTYPTPVGGFMECSAILVAIEPTANVLHDDQWSVDCSWLITTTPTPVPEA